MAKQKTTPEKTVTPKARIFTDYRVPVTRTVRDTRVITVRARDEREARKLAVVEAGMEEWDMFDAGTDESEAGTPEEVRDA